MSGRGLSDEEIDALISAAHESPRFVSLDDDRIPLPYTTRWLVHQQERLRMDIVQQAKERKAHAPYDYSKWKTPL